MTVIPFVDIAKKTVTYGNVPEGQFAFDRLENGRIYAHGKLLQASTPHTDHFIVRDLLSGQNLIEADSEPDNHMSVEYSNIYLNIEGTVQLYFMRDFLNSSHFFDTEKNKFVQAPSTGMSLPAISKIFQADDHQAWFASVQFDIEEANRSVRLLIHPAARPEAFQKIELPTLLHPRDSIQKLDILDLPEGRVFLMWELQTEATRFARVHIFNQKTGELLVVDIPASAGNFRSAQFDAASGSIICLFEDNVTRGPKLVQLFGKAAP